MRWTGADILAQLDEGWEIDEIAAATGMGIAEVKRLIREQRYKNTTQAKVETMTKTKQEETTQAEHPEWEWSSIRALSMLPGAPPYGTLQYRFSSGTAQWAHYETAKPEDLEGVEADPRARSLGRLAPGTTWEPLKPDQDEQPTGPDKAPKRETAKENAQIATLETALIAAREEAAKHKATIAQIAKERDALEKIGEVLARHTAFGGDELSVSEMCELIEAAFEDAGELPVIKRELELVSEKIVELETCYNVARETRLTWAQRAAAAEATLASIQEALEPIGDFAGKDTPIDQRIAQLVERSFREHANLYAMQQAALEFMEKYDVSDDGWWDADLVDYVNAACQGIENHYDRQLKELTEDAAKLPNVRRELERVSENLLAVHRECERRGYGSDDKRSAVEKVRELLDYDEELTHLVARQDQRIKELESKRELTIEETDTPEHHERGEDEAGGTIAQWLDRLADLENEIATAYALRATEDFADPDDRCWDLEHATKHVRRWQEVVEEQDREAGR
jgi:hypothetical protein